MNRRPVLALVAAGLLGGCSYEEIEVEVGHLGKARRDPFLAAQRYLAGMGWDVETAPRLGKLPQYPVTILAPASAFEEVAEAERILKWVGTGGHLVVFLKGGEMHRNDWGFFGEPTEPERRKEREERMREIRQTREKGGRGPVPEDMAGDIFMDESSADSGVKHLLAALGVSEQRPDYGEVRGQYVEREVAVKMPGRFALESLPRRDAEILGKKEAAAIASIRRGEGRVTIAANAQPFRNRYIGEGDNAFLLWLMVGRHDSYGVWFVAGGKVSFFGMLWQRGWAAILAFATLILFWLWKSFVRFGPLAAGGDTSQRQFGSHLMLAGAFLWHQRQSGHLIAPLRRAILAAAARRGLTEGAPDFHEQIAARAGLTPEAVRAALGQVQAATPHQFMNLIADLEKIRNAL